MTSHPILRATEVRSKVPTWIDRAVELALVLAGVDAAIGQALADRLRTAESFRSVSTSTFHGQGGSCDP